MHCNTMPRGHRTIIGVDSNFASENVSRSISGVSKSKNLDHGHVLVFLSRGAKYTKLMIYDFLR